MRSVTGSAWRLLGWALPTLLGCAVAGALTAEAAPAAPACPSGQVAAAGRCAAVDKAAERIDAIVREAMEKHDLKAVLVGLAMDGQPRTLMAWGESMTGVPATSDIASRQ